MVLHDIDLPRIWHGNTLTGVATEPALFEGAPMGFDYILTNPPFGSKEGKDAQAAFAYKTGKAQILSCSTLSTLWLMVALAAWSLTKAFCSTPKPPPTSRPSANC